MDVDALAKLLQTLRSAGVCDAAFHADGTPARLVLAPLEPPARGEGERPARAPADPLGHSRLRPKEPQ